MSLLAKIEAILYLKGQSLSIAGLAELAGCDRTEVEEALIQLMSDYAHRDSALEVVETDSGYSLQLREAYRSLMQKLSSTGVRSWGIKNFSRDRPQGWHYPNRFSRIKRVRSLSTSHRTRRTGICSETQTS